MNRRLLILTMLAWLSNVRLAHWQADTLTNTHRVLGDLYDGMDGFLDEFAEVDMGHEGNTDFPADQAIAITANADLGALMAVGLSTVAQLREGVDNDLSKILDEMQALINRTKFLLKV